MSLVGFWVAWGTITGFGGFGPPRPTPPIASPRLAVVAVCRRGWRRFVFLCFPLSVGSGVAPSPSSSRRVVPRCCPSACVGSRNSPRDAPQLIVSPSVSLGVPVSSSALARDRRELGARPTNYFLFCFSLGRSLRKSATSRTGAVSRGTPAAGVGRLLATVIFQLLKETLSVII